MSRGHLRPLVVILGYTAIGKSDVGIEVANHFNGEIVSADSRQVYKNLDLGTAKVIKEEQELVPHHLLDVARPGTTFTLAEYQQLAFEAIDSILDRGGLPIMVGGTGLYIWAVVDNLKIPRCSPDPNLRAELDQKSTNELVAKLREVDPVSAAKSGVTQNRRRLIRALEVSIKTGIPFSEARGKGPPKYRPLQIGLKMPFEELYERIDKRVDLRFEMGMIDEVKKLLHMGVTHDWLESLGLEYRHISKYLRGEVQSYEETVQNLKTNIHQFAKKQHTWFRRDNRIIWIDARLSPTKKAISIINDFLKNTH
jgi:tRNA dimethylallyltransferase